MNSLIRVAIHNVASNVRSFGIGIEQFLVLLDGNAPIAAIDVATAELQIELLPVAIVSDRRQHLRPDQHPVHTPCSNSILAVLRGPFERGSSDAYLQPTD